MFRSSGKPFTAVTVQIDRLTSEQYEEDDIAGIFDLVEVIRIQSSGPTEAARALRKKLKYGNPHRQLRALVLLDGLIENAGSRFQRTFADEPLLERLRLLPREEVTDPNVRRKCDILFTQWANTYKNTPGLERIANLYKELPKTQRPAQARQKVLADTERYDSDGEAPTSRSRAGSSASPAAPASRSSPPVTLNSTAHHSSGFSSKLSKKSKSGQGKPFSLSREKENMTTSIAQASIASTNLLNGLQLINRETQRVSDNPEVVRRFEACKNLRRKILFYIQNVESDEWIGSLVNANDELVKALTAYEITDRSIDDDSDSDAWEQIGTSTPNPPPAPSAESNTSKLAGLKMKEEAPPVKPPRPGTIPMPPQPSFPATQGAQDTPGDGEDDNDPFGDANAAPTPYNERPGMTWKEDLQKKNGGVVVAERELGTRDGNAGDLGLQRLPSQSPTKADKHKVSQSTTSAAKNSNRMHKDVLDNLPQEQSGETTPESLRLVRSPNTNALPQPPSEAELRKEAYDKMILQAHGGREPLSVRLARLRPKYAEDTTRFSSPVWGEKDPSCRIRIKRKLASLATAIANPINTARRGGRWLLDVFCPCCFEVETPRIFVRKPSDEESRKDRRASPPHATQAGSVERSRRTFRFLEQAHKVNRSRHLLKPPRDTRARGEEEREKMDGGQDKSGAARARADDVVLGEAQRRLNIREGPSTAAQANVDTVVLEERQVSPKTSLDEPRADGKSPPIGARYLREPNLVVHPAIRDSATADNIRRSGIIQVDGQVDDELESSTASLDNGDIGRAQTDNQVDNESESSTAVSLISKISTNPPKISLDTDEFGRPLSLNDAMHYLNWKYQGGDAEPSFLDDGYLWAW